MTQKLLVAWMAVVTLVGLFAGWQTVQRINKDCWEVHEVSLGWARYEGDNVRRDNKRVMDAFMAWAKGAERRIEQLEEEVARQRVWRRRCRP